MKTIGERIREVRISHGRTYRAFADVLGVADTTVMKWERGSSISFLNAIEISEKYHVSLDWLAGKEGDR